MGRPKTRCYRRLTVDRQGTSTIRHAYRQGIVRGRVARARRLGACAVLLTCAIGPAAAHAGDPLLSGYAGPGGGEQVVLGSKLIPAAKGNGSLRASRTTSSGSTSTPSGAGRATSGSGSGAATASPSTATGTSATGSAGGSTASGAAGTPSATGGSGTGTRTGATAADGTTKTSGSTSPSGGASTAGTSAAQGGSATATGNTAATTADARPTAIDSGPSSAPLPLSGEQLLLLLAGLLLLGACGWATSSVVMSGARERRPL